LKIWDIPYNTNSSITVSYYRKQNGEEPVRLFIDSLNNQKLQAKFFMAFVLLEEYRYQLREPYSKYLRDGIFELRIRSGSNAARCLYFFYKEKELS